MKECAGNPFCLSLRPKLREALCAKATLTYQKAKQTQMINSAMPILRLSLKGSSFLLLSWKMAPKRGFSCLKAGIFSGHIFLFERLPFPVTHLLALTDVTRCNFPIYFIEDFFHDNRDFAKALMKNLTLDHAANLSNWVHMHSKNGPEKVAYVYKKLQKLDVDMNSITQEDLALIAGVSRITVARSMKDIYRK